MNDTRTRIEICRSLNSPAWPFSEHRDSDRALPIRADCLRSWSTASEGEGRRGGTGSKRGGGRHRVRGYITRPQSCLLLTAMCRRKKCESGACGKNCRLDNSMALGEQGRAEREKRGGDGCVGVGRRSVWYRRVLCCMRTGTLALVRWHPLSCDDETGQCN
jgi:hypothetical protein